MCEFKVNDKIVTGTQYWYFVKNHFIGSIYWSEKEKEDALEKEANRPRYLIPFDELVERNGIKLSGDELTPFKEIHEELRKRREMEVHRNHAPHMLSLRSETDLELRHAILSVYEMYYVSKGELGTWGTFVLATEVDKHLMAAYERECTEPKQVVITGVEGTPDGTLVETEYVWDETKDKPQYIGPREPLKDEGKRISRLDNKLKKIRLKNIQSVAARYLEAISQGEFDSSRPDPLNKCQSRQTFSCKGNLSNTRLVNTPNIYDIMTSFPNHILSFSDGITWIYPPTWKVPDHCRFTCR